MRKTGKLVVIEGTDGSGKSTQFSLLCQRAREEGLDFQRLVFPQYEEESSALIRMYLRGDFGQNPADVNPYAASAFYAADRYASWKKWEHFYQTGGLVLADRYTTSNAVHQGSKLPLPERAAYFQWLFQFEYQLMGLPRPDLVLYLDLPTPQTLELLRRRQEATHTKGDIHETDEAYLAACRESALQAAAADGWQVISCLDDAGRLRGAAEIQREVWAAVRACLEEMTDGSEQKQRH